MKNNKRVRNDLSLEEKQLRALQGIFILQAAKIDLSGKKIRKILGINMNEVTPILKPITEAIKKQNDRKIKQ